MEKFTTLAELARDAGIPASRITAAVEAGLIQPAGRAGRHPNSPIVFLASEVPNIIEALKASGRMKAAATAPRPAHHCRTTSEVVEKAAALNRARQK